MLRLAILRHAEAMPLAEGGDLDRPLSAVGRKMAERMGRFFRDMDVVPDLALVSPSRRTRETFDELEAGAGQKFKFEIVPALYNASYETLEAVVEDQANEAKVLLLVGHNPGLVEFADALASKGKKAELAKMREHFSTPCLAVIDFDIKSWRKALPGGGRLECFINRGMLAKLLAND